MSLMVSIRPRCRTASGRARRCRGSADPAGLPLELGDLAHDVSAEGDAVVPVWSRQAGGAVLGTMSGATTPAPTRVLLVIASPMGRRRFRHPGRAFHRPHDRDLRPRGVERSQHADGATGSTRDEHADPLCQWWNYLRERRARVIAHIGGAPGEEQIPTAVGGPQRCSRPARGCRRRAQGEWGDAKNAGALTWF